VPKSKPYWVDELGRKQEAYGYDDDGSDSLTVEHQGRSLHLLLPKLMPPVEFRVTASSGDFLFLIGEQQDEEDEDGEVIEGGNGGVIIARRHPERRDTYWVFVWHYLFPETLRAVPNNS
jgi:hypothetical protein